MDESSKDGRWATYDVEAENCIGCGLCHERAPDNLEIPEGEPAAKIVRQPDSADEEEACEEAADYCPTGGLVKNSSADS